MSDTCTTVEKKTPSDAYTTINPVMLMVRTFTACSICRQGSCVVPRCTFWPAAMGKYDMMLSFSWQGTGSQSDRPLGIK